MAELAFYFHVNPMILFTIAKNALSIFNKNISLDSTDHRIFNHSLGLLENIHNAIEKLPKKDRFMTNVLYYLSYYLSDPWDALGFLNCLSLYLQFVFSILDVIT